MRRRKLRKGRRITSLDKLEKSEWVIVHGKPYHHNWVISWQLRMAMHYVGGGYAYEGIRLTNGEYYAHLSDEKIRERFGEEIHQICPYHNRAYSSMASACEGAYCDEALDCWKEEPVK